MQRVTGIGGIFFKARDAERLREWYRTHLLLSVADLDGLLAALRVEGCQVEARIEESEFGRFGWVMDPEQNKVELWEPPRV
jgi:predicted enzyme related to lactoylglutathione lyase